jgi:hypothetical protein
MTTPPTWREEIEAAMQPHGETLDDVVDACLPLPEWIDMDIYQGHVEVDGYPAFTIWTSRRVYFPWHYDGWYRVGSVSRSPDGTRTRAYGDG